MWDQYIDMYKCLLPLILPPIAWSNSGLVYLITIANLVFGVAPTTVVVVSKPGEAKR
jgi:hypothetical protein